jgi:hypothetical protein
LIGVLGTDLTVPPVVYHVNSFSGNEKYELRS